MRFVAPLSIGCAALLAAGTASAEKSAKPPVPAVGLPCTKLGAAYKALDCVATGAANKWELRGTQLDPYKLGVAARFGPLEGRPKVQYAVTVLTPAAAVPPSAIGAPDPTRKPIPPGHEPVALKIRLTDLGTESGDPYADGAEFALVAGTGTVYKLYAGAECALYGKGLPDEFGFRSADPGRNTGSVCAVIPSGQLNAKLLFRVTVDYAAAGGTGGSIWFRTSK